MIKSYKEAEEKFNEIESSYLDGKTSRMETMESLSTLYYSELTDFHNKKIKEKTEDNEQFGRVGAKILSCLTLLIRGNDNGEMGD